MFVRPFLRMPILVAVVLAAPALALTDPDPGITTAVAELFMARPDEPFVSVVLRDEPRGNYLAFHISTYLDVRELRVYWVPFASADRLAVDTALDAGDHESAYQTLMAGMRLELGARYVSDAGLDGVNDVPIAIGEGMLRDNFHRDQFAGYPEADDAYRKWITRALELARR